MKVTTQSRFKTCSNCDEEKPLDEFYEHSEMDDGHLNQCKECKREYQRKHRKENVEYYREYDRERFQNDPKRREKQIEYQRKRRKKNPQKQKARDKVNNAIRDGRLEKEPCEVCGDQNSEAHHEDYSKPLDVTWLCRKHHLMEHDQYITD